MKNIIFLFTLSLLLAGCRSNGVAHKIAESLTQDISKWEITEGFDSLDSKEFLAISQDTVMTPRAKYCYLETLKMRDVTLIKMSNRADNIELKGRIMQGDEHYKWVGSLEMKAPYSYSFDATEFNIIFDAYKNVRN